MDRWYKYIPNKSKSKYGANKTVVDGIEFDSKKEARRWQELKIMESAGLISDMQRQVKFILIPAQREKDTIGKRGGVIKGKLIEREVAYIADFVYQNEYGERIVEDTKGMKTKEYIIKRKMMLWFYGIRITEV